jgi:hypothetical protein
MERILQLMRTVYGDDSQETSRAEQIVNAIVRLKRELVRSGVDKGESASA